MNVLTEPGAYELGGQFFATPSTQISPTAQASHRHPTTATPGSTTFLKPCLHRHCVWSSDPVPDTEFSGQKHAADDELPTGAYLPFGHGCVRFGAPPGQ